MSDTCFEFLRAGEEKELLIHQRNRPLPFLQRALGASPRISTLEPRGAGGAAISLLSLAEPRSSLMQNLCSMSREREIIWWQMLGAEASPNIQTLL